jgi:hypothetical protein
VDSAEVGHETALRSALNDLAVLHADTTLLHDAGRHGRQEDSVMAMMVWRGRRKCCRKKGGLHHKDIHTDRQRHRNQVHREMSRAGLLWT